MRASPLIRLRFMALWSGLLAAGFSPRTDQHFSSTVAALEKALAVELTGDLVELYIPVKSCDLVGY